MLLARSTRRMICAVLLTAAVVLFVRLTGVAFSQQMPMPDGDMTGHDMTGEMPGMTSGTTAGRTPTLPGQDAFGAIQEIVRLLEADPSTDWSKVDLERLRQHLIDMNEVTLRAEAAPRPVEGGLEIAVTGTGRTLEAIQRMVPDQTLQLNQMHGWRAKTASLQNGVLLTVTAGDVRETAHIRGLGFIGLMASGSHHQAHHIAMARGEMIHPASPE